jgi:hypothetical protein
MFIPRVVVRRITVPTQRTVLSVAAGHRQMKEGSDVIFQGHLYRSQQLAEQVSRSLVQVSIDHERFHD